MDDHLSRQNGTGTGYNPLIYHATDPFPATGSNYYRLKEMAFDGQETYFEVLHVEFENVAEGKGLSTPVLGMNSACIEEAIREISIYDQQGRPAAGGFPATRIALIEVGFCQQGCTHLPLPPKTGRFYKKGAAAVTGFILQFNAPHKPSHIEPPVR
ncbi:MAG: hypothetical protein IPN76_06825 [Saprospiraceae bacterium]|nr:hypothetical protein [Saprospiraceae bacterium]